MKHLFLLGINDENLGWMLKEALTLADKDGVFNGVLLLDEMSIQKDLQIIKRGRDWHVMGAVDLGSLVNDLDEIGNKANELEVVIHYFQYMYIHWIQWLLMACCLLWLK